MKERQNILIVDDEENNIKLLKGLLNKEPYHIVEALNGEDALKIVNETQLDLIMLDVMMPGLDGFEICRVIKEDEKTRVIPVLMITALSGKEDRYHAMQYGADDFLVKPVDKLELLIRTKSLLRIKSYHDSLTQSLQEISEKNEKLIHLEKFKESLINMIIHDLNNPLTAISGLIDLAIEENVLLSEKNVRWLSNSFDHCQDLKMLIKRILDISRMREGKLSLAKEDTCIVELTNSVVTSFANRMEEKHISLSFHGIIDLPRLNIDPDIIKRVIATLLSNAVRDTPDCGKIEITIHYRSDQRDICFSISDNGAGVPSEYHHEKFNMCEQHSSKRTGVISGNTGLGLAFCKMAVEAHQGEIWVENDGEGKGKTFSFSLSTSEIEIAQAQ